MSNSLYGAHGIVLPYPINQQSKFPTHVTKIFYTEPFYDTIMKKQELIRSIFPDDPNYRIHIFPTRPQFKTIKNSTNRKTVSNAIRHHGRSDGVYSHRMSSNEEFIYAVHMPHLGVDLEHIPDILKQLRAIPVHTMLTNMRDLLDHVALLWNDKSQDRQFIHGDIRPPNIMIRPDTGKMTMIDFDWLKPVKEFAAIFPYGAHYYIPPELLLYSIGRYANITGESWISNKLSDQLQKLIEVHGDVIKATCEARKIFTYESHVEATACASLKDAIRDSVIEWNNMAKEGRVPMMASYRTFDGYGIGQNLLELCHRVYPGSMTNELDPSMPQEEQTALYAMIHDVLRPLCALSLRDRRSVHELHDVVVGIIANLEQAHPPHAENNMRELQRLQLMNRDPHVQRKALENLGNKGGTRRPKGTKGIKRTKRTKRTRRHNRIRQ